MLPYIYIHILKVLTVKMNLSEYLEKLNQLQSWWLAELVTYKFAYSQCKIIFRMQTSITKILLFIMSKNIPNSTNIWDNIKSDFSAFISERHFRNLLKSTMSEGRIGMFCESVDDHLDKSSALPLRVYVFIFSCSFMTVHDWSRLSGWMFGSDLYAYTSHLCSFYKIQNFFHIFYICISFDCHLFLLISSVYP